MTQNSPVRRFVVSRNGVPAALRGAVAAIGNFDGVHRGHRSVVQAAIARAKRLGRPAIAMTFAPHPRMFFRPQDPHFTLNDERSKMRLLSATGLDGAAIYTFDAALSALPAEAFIEKVLVDQLQIAGVAVGYNFHFGKGRSGSPQFLEAEGRRRGFTVDIVPALADGDRAVTSGAVRAALAQGKVEEAADLLGMPWFVSAPVIHGEKRGRDLGFPTANMKLDPSCALRHGIYAVRVEIDGARFDGVASFGRRPTFDNGAPLLETFVFDFTGDLYGKTLDVAFIGWIRDEMTFDGVEPLKRQMQDDCRRARDILGRSPDAFPVLGDI